MARLSVPDHNQPPVDQRDQALVLTPRLVTGLLFAGLIAVASIGPWYTNGISSQAGLENGDGWLSLTAAAVAGGAILRRASGWLPLLAGAFAILWGILAQNNVPEGGLLEARAGWGAQLLLWAGIGLLIWAVALIADDRRLLRS